MAFGTSRARRATVFSLAMLAGLGGPALSAFGQEAAPRKAFDERMSDREFQADAARRQFDLDPVGGAEIQKIMDKMYMASPAVIGRVKKILADKI